MKTLKQHWSLPFVFCVSVALIWLLRDLGTMRFVPVTMLVVGIPLGLAFARVIEWRIDRKKAARLQREIPPVIAKMREAVRVSENAWHYESENGELTLITVDTPEGRLSMCSVFEEKKLLSLVLGIMKSKDAKMERLYCSGIIITDFELDPELADAFLDLKAVASAKAGLGKVFS